MSTVQVGFSPAAGNSVTTGVAAGAVAAASGASGDDAAADPLGFLGSLLDLLGQSLGLPQLADGQSPGNSQSGSGSGVTFAPPTTAAAAATEAAIKSDLDKRELGTDGQKLLNDLISALSAMDEAGDSGQPVDPALEKKLSDTIDGIAGLLGITLPAPPAVDPAITEAAAAGSSGTAPEVGATDPAAPTPVPPPAAGSAPSAGTAPQDAAADDFAAAVQAATAPKPPRETDDQKKPDHKADGAANARTPDVWGSTDSPDSPVPPTPESRIARLVDKLHEVAEKLDLKSPEVAAKLQKLADVLAAASGDDKAAIARLGADLDDADIAALTATKPDSKPAPAPQPFVQPVLPAPTTAMKTAAGETGAESRPVERPAEKVAEPAADEPETARPVADAKPAERPAEKPAHENRRADFAQHLAEARGERLADAAEQTQQGQTAVAAAGRTEAAVVPKTVHAAYQAPVQQVNLPQVAFEVVRQFHQGNSRFQIRLDPPELGRIDVRMQIDGDGNVQARMTVERAETLDLMQRDQRHLERALAQAGLDASKTSLEFSLRQNPQGRDAQQFAQQFNQNNQQGGHRSNWQDRGGNGAAELPEITTTQYRGLASPSGVNLFV